MEQKTDYPIIYGMLCVVISPRLKKLLLLKRAPTKKVYPNLWAVVGAYPFFEKVNIHDIAIREIKDELGLHGKVLKVGEEFSKIANLEDKTIELRVTPVIASVDSEEITLNDEHTEYKWVDISELKNFDLAPDIDTAITALDTEKYAS